MEILDLKFEVEEATENSEWSSENIQWSFKQNGYGILKKQKNKIFVYEESECMWIIDSIYFFNRNDLKIYKLGCWGHQDLITSVECVSDEFEYIDEEILFEYVQKEAEKMAGKYKI